MTQAWLEQQCAAVAEGDATTLGIALGLAGRRLGPAAAEGRIRLLCAFPPEPVAAWLATLDRVFAAASIEESVTYYANLHRLPHPERLRPRAAVGIRSSAAAIVTAITLDNPYPCRWLDTVAVNQMVLKAFFLGLDHRRIIGLAERTNPELTRMLAGWVHERQAAGRSVPEGVWDPLFRLEKTSKNS